MASKNDRKPGAAIYLALDFDGVLHSKWTAPRTSECISYGKGVISRQEFIETTNQLAKEFAIEEDWTAGELFDRSEILADEIALSGADVRLVIATSWRNRMSGESLRALLPQRLGDLVVGTIDRDEDEFRAPGVRGDLMERWTKVHAPDAAWLALDDAPELWANHSPRLIQTEACGLDDQSAASLRACLKHLRRPPYCERPVIPS